MNVDTTTCELIISISKENTVSKCVFFHKNNTDRWDRLFGSFLGS